MEFRPLTPSEIGQLKNQANYCADWTRITLHDGCDLRLVRGNRFVGTVKIGAFSADSGREEGIFNAVIYDCTIGDHAFISGVAGRLEGLTVGAGARIENVGRIIAEPEADFGVGTMVSVLDETGSRPVYIYPGLTAQIATMMAHRPGWTEDTFKPLLDEMRDSMPPMPTIGEEAVVQDCRYIFNVRIGRGVSVLGASYLKNGTILSNGATNHSLTLVGNDVDAEDFIVEDGKVDSGTLLRRVYVGQGVELEKRFTAHDSLFFANSSCENGEACAIIAGPYTVTMHKSSLLIGGEYSFFNAGSGTNASNHKYKLGPVHWGTMQRGVKAASSAYIMWGGRIGAFSLLMGAHKQHPDTAAFPFSYLFGQESGATLVAPGLMLKSCGLMRDQLKWPKRDRRIKGRVPLRDHINFEVLNPLTVGAMIEALPLLRQIASTEPAADGLYHWRGLLMRPSAVHRAQDLYRLAIAKYFATKLAAPAPEPPSSTAVSGSPWESPSPSPRTLSAVFGGEAPEESVSPSATLTVPIRWLDLGGQILPYSTLEAALQAETLPEIHSLLDAAFEAYPSLERRWILSVLTPELKAELGDLAEASARLDALVEKDRHDYLQSLTAHNNLLTL